MKIYFVETNARNELIAVECNKAKELAQVNGILVGTNIDLQETDANGAARHNGIITSLKKYLSETPLNDYDDIYSDNEFRWNINDFKNVTRVY